MIIKIIKEFYNETNTGLLFQTSGTSMWPLIETNDRIEIIYRDLNKLKIGDIILTNSNNELIAHRIKSIKPQIITKGDNSLKDDIFIVNENTYLGVLISIEKTRFKLKLKKKILKKYYQVFKILGYNIKYLDFLRKLWLKGKLWKEQ